MVGIVTAICVGQEQCVDVASLQEFGQVDPVF